VSGIECRQMQCTKLGWYVDALQQAHATPEHCTSTREWHGMHSARRVQCARFSFTFNICCEVHAAILVCRCCSVAALLGCSLHVLLLLLPPAFSRLQCLQHAVPHRVPQGAVAAGHSQHGDHGAGPAWTWPPVRNGLLIVSGPYITCIQRHGCHKALEKMCAYTANCDPVYLPTASCCRFCL
jgi:hypothetical protein